MKINCSHCGNQYEVEDRYMGQTLKCPDCGNEITINNPKLAPCPDCLTLISKRARTCPHCGAPLMRAEKILREHDFHIKNKFHPSTLSSWKELYSGKGENQEKKISLEHILRWKTVDFSFLLIYNIANHD